MRSDIFILLLVLLCACRAHPHTRIGALSARGKDSDLRRHSLARTCPEPVLGRPLRLAGGSGGVESDPRSMIEEGERLFAVATGRRQGEQEGQSSCLKALVRLLMGGNPLDMSAAKKTALLEQAAVRWVEEEEGKGEAEEGDFREEMESRRREGGILMQRWQDMFESASVKSKLQADLKQAGFALMRAAECYKNIRDRSFEAADKFFEAGNILKQDSVQDALESFRRAADLYMTVVPRSRVGELTGSQDKNAINLQAAARIFREMVDRARLSPRPHHPSPSSNTSPSSSRSPSRARRSSRSHWYQGTLYEQEGDSESSISSYQRAVDLFKADGMPSLADGCLVKWVSSRRERLLTHARMANLAAASRKFPTAISSYRQLIKAADVSEGKSAGGCSGEDLRFRSLLCYLAQGALDEFQSAFQDYVEADLSFRDSAFAHIAEKLREAVVSKSMDVFNKQVEEVDEEGEAMGPGGFGVRGSSGGWEGRGEWDTNRKAGERSERVSNVRSQRLFSLHFDQVDPLKTSASLLAGPRGLTAWQGEEGKRLEQQLATQDDEDIL